MNIMNNFQTILLTTLFAISLSGCAAVAVGGAIVSTGVGVATTGVKVAAKGVGAGAKAIANAGDDDKKDAKQDKDD